LKTGQVLNELRSPNWLGGELGEDDLIAVYEKSHKKIFDSIVKYSRKELVAKHELYPIGEACEFGEWKITELGKERAWREGILLGAHLRHEYRNSASRSRSDDLSSHDEF